MGEVNGFAAKLHLPPEGNRSEERQQQVGLALPLQAAQAEQLAIVQLKADVMEHVRAQPANLQPHRRIRRQLGAPGIVRGDHALDH